MSKNDVIARLLLTEGATRNLFVEGYMEGFPRVVMYCNIGS